jgi:hypothetical protein
MGNHRGEESGESNEQDPIASKAMGAESKHGCVRGSEGIVRVGRVGRGAERYEMKPGSEARAFHVAQAPAHASRSSSTL